MDTKVLTEQMLAKKLQELNGNADEFIRWVAGVILLPDAEQISMIESFKEETKVFVRAQKDALESEKLKAEAELTKGINALTALDGKIKKQADMAKMNPEVIAE